MNRVDAADLAQPRKGSHAQDAFPVGLGNRMFQVWSFEVGHGVLLLRSTPTKEHVTCHPVESLVSKRVPSAS